MTQIFNLLHLVKNVIRRHQWANMPHEYPVMRALKAKIWQRKRSFLVPRKVRFRAMTMSKQARLCSFGLTKTFFSRSSKSAFSRHDNVRASSALFIWLNENVLYRVAYLAFSSGRGSFLASITTWKTKSVTHFWLNPSLLLYCLIEATVFNTPASEKSFLLKMSLMVRCVMV